MILSIHIHLYLLLHDLHDRNKVDTALKIDFAFVDTYNYLQHNLTLAFIDTSTTFTATQF